MDKLFSFFKHKLEDTSTRYFRYKYHEIHWSGRVFGIVGPRGVGKSTMLLQYIKENLDVAHSLYISADQLYFATHSLLEVADQFSKMNGKHLFIDEIHKYPDWSRELKEIIDTYSDMQVVISGSSILDIFQGMADLSRRMPIYEMQGLSFREYLALFHDIEVSAYSLSQILAHQATIPSVAHPLPLFKDYLRRGYYPFGIDVDFDIELLQVLTQTMETDIPNFANISVSAGRKLKQLLMVIAQSVPFKPVFQKLAEVTKLSRNDIPTYLHYMERAGVIAMLRDSTTGIRSLGKVEKVYLDNTNIIYALASHDANIGNVRETFFMNQMRVKHPVVCSKISDFEVNDITFEVGGKKKGKKQIEAAKNAYIVKDDIEFGYGNVVPLWAFGLNY